jgi:hypothetical protein
MSSPTTVLPPGSTPDTDTFQIESQPPNVGFLKRAVQPPSDVYIETSDVLVFACATNQSNETITVSYRFLRFDGVVIHGQFTISPPSTRALVVHQEQLAEGFLLSMSCKAAAAVTRGQTFARAFLTKPSLGAGQPSYMLMADYVTTAMAPAFPNGRILQPSEGPGWRHSITATVPPAGTEWHVTVPTNARYRIDSALSNLQTGAAAGNRFAGVAIESASNATFIGCAENTQAASVVGQITYSSTVNKPTGGVGAYWVPLIPDLILAAGDGIFSNTPGLQAADQYQFAFVYVEEWLDNV